MCISSIHTGCIRTFPCGFRVIFIDRFLKFPKYFFVELEKIFFGGVEKKMWVHKFSKKFQSFHFWCFHDHPRTLRRFSRAPLLFSPYMNNTLYPVPLGDIRRFHQLGLYIQGYVQILKKKKKLAPVGGDGVLRSLWKPHKSKARTFLNRSYTPKIFSTPTKNIFSSSIKIIFCFFGHFGVL